MPKADNSGAPVTLRAQLESHPTGRGKEGRKGLEDSVKRNSSHRAAKPEMRIAFVVVAFAALTGCASYGGPKERALLESLKESGIFEGERPLMADCKISPDGPGYGTSQITGRVLPYEQCSREGRAGLEAARIYCGEKAYSRDGQGLQMVLQSPAGQNILFSMDTPAKSIPGAGESAEIVKSLKKLNERGFSCM